VTDTLPQPEKRRAFTAREVASVFIKYDARCASCRDKVKLGEYAIDHIQALDHLGKHELDNWQLLCTPCHIVKTKRDVSASAKGRRIRGEVGQGQKRPIPSRGFQKRTTPHKWPKRGFGK
jgi:5-methylcytosine-specific restriction endonuclease McrA